VQKVLDEFDKFDGPTYHMFGNHCLYNLPRSKLVSLLKMRTDSDHAYYDFSPCPELRIVVLDAYDFSCLGWPHDHPVTAAATKLLDEKNPNTDKNSPDGLVGVARRFVMFNGAVGKEQLSWLNDVLQDASALHLKVRKRHTLHFPFRALNRQLYMYMSGAPWHSLVTNRTTTPLQTWRS